MPGQKDNTETHHKLAVRRRAAETLGEGDFILEAFAGSGEMYSALWHRWAGFTMDKDLAKVTRAAKQRKRWGCYQGDTLRALEAGWLENIEFKLVDFDPYGEPWPALQAYFAGHLAFHSPWVAVCTDGYWSQRNLASKSRCLFGYGGGRFSGMSDRAYIEICHDFVRSLASRYGQELVSATSERRTLEQKGVGQHIFRFQKREG